MKGTRFQRRKILSLLAAVFLLLFSASMATAKATSTAKDEKKLTSEISLIDKDASMPKGDLAVTDRLSKEFKITGDQIKLLRDQGLGYGEIAAIYAFGDKMSGGVNDSNVSAVMSERKTNKGWDMIAKDLNVDLGHVAGKVKSIEKDVYKDIKKASAETRGSAGGGIGKEGRPQPDRSDEFYNG